MKTPEEWIALLKNNDEGLTKDERVKVHIAMYDEMRSDREAMCLRHYDAVQARLKTASTPDLNKKLSSYKNFG